MGATKPAVAEPLSTERQALADAIEALRQFDSALVELAENEAIRTSYYYECSAAADAAKNALRDGIQWMRQAATMAGRPSWEDPPAPPLALVEAVPATQARFEEALAARDSARHEVNVGQIDRKRLEDDVQRKALAVMVQHAADTGLADEVVRLQRQSFDLGLRLAWLHRYGQIDPTRAEKLTLWRVRDCAGWADDMPDVPGASVYVEALNRLMTDATTEVP